MLQCRRIYVHHKIIKDWIVLWLYFSVSLYFAWDVKVTLVHKVKCIILAKQLHCFESPVILSYSWPSLLLYVTISEQTGLPWQLSSIEGCFDHFFLYLSSSPGTCYCHTDAYVQYIWWRLKVQVFCIYLFVFPLNYWFWFEPRLCLFRISQSRHSIIIIISYNIWLRLYPLCPNYMCFCEAMLPITVQCHSCCQSDGLPAETKEAILSFRTHHNFKWQMQNMYYVSHNFDIFSRDIWKWLGLYFVVSTVPPDSRVKLDIRICLCTVMNKFWGFGASTHTVPGLGQLISGDVGNFSINALWQVYNLAIARVIWLRWQPYVHCLFPAVY